MRSNSTNAEMAIASLDAKRILSGRIAVRFVAWKMVERVRTGWRAASWLKLAYEVFTGIAIIVFGFVIEKFNLFIFAMANASSTDAGHRLQLERLSGPFGRYDGFALIVVGLVLIIVAAARFVRTGRRLDDQEMHSAGSIRAELILSATLALIVAGFSTFLVLG